MVPAGLTYQREHVLAVCEEAAPLLYGHWREVAAFPDIAPRIDWRAYGTAEDAGLFRCFTARCEGALVGYSSFVVRMSPHYGASKQASHDTLYLHPDYRHGMNGLKFLHWCDERLRAEGVQLVYQMVKLAHNHGALLERLGYEPIEQTYVKRLDR